MTDNLVLFNQVFYEVRSRHDSYKLSGVCNRQGVEFVFRENCGNVENSVALFNGDDVFGHHLVDGEVVVHRRGQLISVYGVDEADFLQVRLAKHPDHLSAGDDWYVPDVLAFDDRIYLAEVLGDVDGNDVGRHDLGYWSALFHYGVFNGEWLRKRSR